MALLATNLFKIEVYVPSSIMENSLSVIRMDESLLNFGLLSFHLVAYCRITYPTPPPKTLKM